MRRRVKCRPNHPMGSSVLEGQSLQKGGGAGRKPLTKVPPRRTTPLHTPRAGRSYRDSSCRNMLCRKRWGRQFFRDWALCPKSNTAPRRLHQHIPPPPFQDGRELHADGICPSPVPEERTKRPVRTRKVRRPVHSERNAFCI